MKKILALLLILFLLCPASLHAESFYEWLDTALGSGYSYAEVGDKLVILCEYDNLAEESTALITGGSAFHSDDLVPYSSVVLLMMKDGAIYLGAELPLTEGTVAEGGAHPLMSVAFLQNNISLGN